MSRVCLSIMLELTPRAAKTIHRLPPKAQRPSHMVASVAGDQNAGLLAFLDFPSILESMPQDVRLFT